MTIQHHPSHAILIQHAAGGLDSGPALVLATHLAACPTCREALAVAESLGGALLADLPPARMNEHALAKVLARTERPIGPIPARSLVQRRHDWIETPSEVVEAASRRRWVAPGVWTAHVGRKPDKGKTYLLRVAAGMGVPTHTHRGSEFLCVLKGDFSDAAGVYRAGDFIESDEDIEHRPMNSGSCECVCLVYTDNALVPRDWIGRLFQPFVGI